MNEIGRNAEAGALYCGRKGFIGLGVGALLAQCLPAIPVDSRRKIQSWYRKVPEGAELLDIPVMKGFKPTKLEIRVGAKKPFGMLHMSDSHIAWMNSKDLMKADEVDLRWYESRRRHFATNATGLAAALAYAKAKNLHILHTGDLVDYISDANINYIRTDLEGTGCLYAIGNHERAGTPNPSPSTDMLPALRKKLEPYFPNPFCCASRIINGVNFVTFDNIGMCRDIFNAQFAAIKAEFAKGLPVVLACHIPFYTKELGDAQLKATPKMKTHNDITEAYLASPPNGRGYQINRKLREWLPKQKNLKALLCGHKHVESHSFFCENVMQYVAGATYKGNAYEITFT